jgi:hypothetical protein
MELWVDDVRTKRDNSTTDVRSHEEDSTLVIVDSFDPTTIKCVLRGGQQGMGR